jgi:DNA-binding beta-propeller fold protein YncE
MSPLSVTVHPSGKFAYATNQDDGTVSMYTINTSTGVLTPMTPPTVPAGGSPFEVTMDPSGKFAYVPDAYGNNEVSEYTIDPVTGVLNPSTEIRSRGRELTRFSGRGSLWQVCLRGESNGQHDLDVHHRRQQWKPAS